MGERRDRVQVPKSIEIGDGKKKVEPREDFWHVWCDALAVARIAINRNFGNITRTAGHCRARFRLLRYD